MRSCFVLCFCLRVAIMELGFAIGGKLCVTQLLKSCSMAVPLFQRVANGAHAWLHAATREDMASFKFTLARTASSNVSKVRMAR